MKTLFFYGIYQKTEKERGRNASPLREIELKYNLNQIASNFSLYLLCYAKAWNKLTGPISGSLRPGNKASFEEMSQRWRAVGNTVFDLTEIKIEPQTSRTRNKGVTVRPTGG